MASNILYNRSTRIPPTRNWFFSLIFLLRRLLLLWHSLLYFPASALSLSPRFFVLLVSRGGCILVSDYVRIEVTLVGASWDVVAGVQ